jgi:phosphopantetheine--protein transferase-like protein
MRILGHGIDLVEIARIQRMLADHGERFLERCFTPAEREYAEPARRREEHLAARFAAKEAVLKAMGTGLDDGLAWTEIEDLTGAHRVDRRGVGDRRRVRPGPAPGRPGAERVRLIPAGRG